MSEYERQMEEYFRNLAEEARAKGLILTFEVTNISYHGQAAVNIANGLPPDADPSEVKGCFNDWLQDFLPPAS